MQGTLSLRSPHVKKTGILFIFAYNFQVRINYTPRTIYRTPGISKNLCGTKSAYFSWSVHATDVRCVARGVAFCGSHVISRTFLLYT